MIAELKGRIARGELETPEKIRGAIDEMADHYEIRISDEDKEKLAALLEKLKGLDLDWDGIADRASQLANQLGDAIEKTGFWDAVGAFFKKLIDAVRSWFS